MALYTPQTEYPYCVDPALMVEGRCVWTRDQNLMLAESLLTHGSGLAVAGEPVYFGAGYVGIAAITAQHTSHIIPIHIIHNGVWVQYVVGTNGSDSAVAVGDAVYFNTTTGVLSKTTSGGVKIGIACGTVEAGATSLCPVAFLPLN